MKSALECRLYLVKDGLELQAAYTLILSRLSDARTIRAVAMCGSCLAAALFNQRPASAINLLKVDPFLNFASQYNYNIKFNKKSKKASSYSYMTLVVKSSSDVTPPWQHRRKRK